MTIPLQQLSQQFMKEKLTAQKPVQIGIKRNYANSASKQNNSNQNGKTQVSY